jgi:hypothetical protein
VVLKYFINFEKKYQMQAIEINSRTDNSGHLRIDIPTKRSNKSVRIIILVGEDEDILEEEKIWLYANSKNPSFDFLHEPEEDIYSLKDGEPLNYER